MFLFVHLKCIEWLIGGRVYWLPEWQTRRLWSTVGDEMVLDRWMAVDLLVY